MVPRPVRPEGLICQEQGCWGYWLPQTGYGGSPASNATDVPFLLDANSRLILPEISDPEFPRSLRVGQARFAPGAGLLMRLTPLW